MSSCGKPCDNQNGLTQPLIPVQRQRQADLLVGSQPGLYWETLYLKTRLCQVIKMFMFKTLYELIEKIMGLHIIY